MRPLYISATLQDCGKTSLTLGLMQVLRERGYDPGYIKPVGQRYVDFQGENLDEDAVLVYEAFNLKDKPKLLSPIAIERGFTRKFIMDPKVEPLEQKILNAMNELKQNHPMVLVEGTGHAGVGSCFGLSNARVAQLTGSDVIIVTSGGIGKPLDEVAVSLALFQKHNVNVRGVILNKVLESKYEKIRETVEKGLKLLGTRLLGAIPFNPTLNLYNLGQVAQEFGYEVLCGHQHLKNKIENIVVAAMEPQNVLQYMFRRSLIITPGDRIDNILLAMSLSRSKDYHACFCSCGIILTGGLMPDKAIMDLVANGDIPILATEQDTYAVTSRMKDLAFKINTEDGDKILMTKSLVEQYIDIDHIISAIKD